MTDGDRPEAWVPRENYERMMAKLDAAVMENHALRGELEAFHRLEHERRCGGCRSGRPRRFPCRFSQGCGERRGVNTGH